MSSLAASRSAAFGTRLTAPAPAARRPAAAGALLVEAAHKKGAGSIKNSDDSAAQRLGVKVFGDQPAFSGNIIIRQRGTVVRRPCGKPAALKSVRGRVCAPPGRGRALCARVPAQACTTRAVDALACRERPWLRRTAPADASTLSLA